MPIPKPTENETEFEFLQRCMEDSVMTDEFEENEQRYAVCVQQWEDSKE